MSSVQTFLGERVTNYVNDKYSTNIVVEKVDLSFLGNVDLKGITIKDHQKDSLIYVKSLVTSVFNYQDILNNKLELSEADLKGVTVNMTTHKGEDDDNLSIFIDRFDDGKPSSGTPFLMTSARLNLENVNFILTDRNKQEEPIVFYKKIKGAVEDFKIEGPNVYANIRDLSFVEDHGIEVTSLSSDFTYTKTQMNFKNTHLKTAHSDVHGTAVFNYKREDLADFNNKVMIDGVFSKSTISFIDLNKFYNEFGRNTIATFTTNFKGVLNDFTLEDFNLASNRKSVIDSDLHFKNVIDREKGFSLDARIYELSSNYQSLKKLLPNILGKTLPSTFNKFGKFNLAGRSYITEKAVNANITIHSKLGRVISDLKLTNIDNIDNAKYKGSIELVNLDFGSMVNDTLIGKLSLVADVDGKGFTLDKIDTKIQGKVFKHQYKGYTYSNIDVNGVFKNKLFNGILTANDENLKMTFMGLADLSSTNYKFDFKASVAHADFNRLNLFTRDKKSILKGDIDINLSGNTLDNVEGVIKFKNSSYTNQNDNYFFKDFNLTSKFQDSVRVLTFNSSDIIEGKVKGIFKFNELPTLARNSLGSIYTNYVPNKVTTGQFLDFNFKIYNKIVEVFFPKVNLGANTTIKGEVNSDKNKFELLVKSPKIEVYNNIIDKIRLQIDNKNPLYNTLLSVDKVDTKYYNIANLNLVNVTLNDTLFFRTDFIGGKNLKEKFDLSFYHTINKNNKSVVGLKKSNIRFKDNDWAINPSDNKQNKVVISEDFKLFAFDKINAVSKNQKIDIAGIIDGNNDKDLNLNLENVFLAGITPVIDNLKLNGLVNGSVNFKQVKGRYLPVANVAIDKLKINDISQGDLAIKANGVNSLQKFEVVATLQNEAIKSLDVKGEINFEEKDPTIFANYALKEYDIRAFNPLGEGVLDKIRGKVSGVGMATGLLKDPDLDGELFIENGGLAFPYLNVNYDLIGKTKVKLKGQTFKFLPATLLDVVHDTEATLSGEISHQAFDNWYLDLAIKTDNLLVLNTKESEEIPYYGTGFIEGAATIEGFTDALTINVEGTTKPGTEFIIPLSDVSTIGDSKLVNFVNKMQKNTNDNIVEDVFIDNLKGLSLNFLLTATDDATAEIVVDRNTGSILRGNGNGTLDIKINTNGEFSMVGAYVVTSGIYEFRNIVNKDFKVQPGGSVIWNGNPFDAFLNNITAIYKSKANPKVLLDGLGSREIDVDLIAKISGQLLNSNIEFDLEIPNASSSVKSELDFKLNSQDKKMTQFLSLLAFGDFTNIEEEGGFINQSAIAGTFISEKISNVLSGLLKSRGEKFDVGLSYAVGRRDNINDNLNTADQLGVTASGRLGGKMIWSGKASVPVGGNTQSRVVGEVEVELPLNKAETFRLKAYNRQNEVQFAAAEEEGYTQGIGLSYQVDFDNLKELGEKIFGKKKTKNKEKKDSLKLKNTLVKFTAKKNDTTSVVKKKN